VDRVRQSVEKIEIGLNVTPTQEHVEKLAEIRIAQAMAWITSAIALLIGTLGTLNTMVMSVRERTREIGVLRAIGWPRSRVIRMVLGESVMLSVLGGVMGIAAAFLLLQVLVRLPGASGFVVRYVEFRIVLLALGISVVVGVLGGLMPGLRAAAMQPTRAIHSM
jgi:putative ABC transport system permease protein